MAEAGKRARCEESADEAEDAEPCSSSSLPSQATKRARLCSDSAEVVSWALEQQQQWWQPQLVALLQLAGAQGAGNSS